MRFPALVLPDGTLRPNDREKFRHLEGREVWLSLHRGPAPGLRSSDANRYYWGVVIRAICEETGNDPESAHYGLKAEAVRVGILEPTFITVGDELLPADPTTVTDVDTFKRYVDWVVDWARTKLDVHVEDYT